MITRRQVVGFVLALALVAGALGSLSAQQTDHFYVIGVVKKPGAYAHTANMTVGDALSRAGGFARQASGLEIIRIVSGDKQTVGATLTDAVLPNDVVNAKP